MVSRLRHRLSLQQEVQTADGAGGYIRTWQTLADLWAEFQAVTGKEILIAGKLQSEVSHKITIRYRTGVTAGMRLVYDSRIFDIKAVVNKQENDEVLELWVSEND